MSQQPSEGKWAPIDSIQSITVMCPDCEVECENQSGTRIIVQGEDVTCPSCQQRFQVDQFIFQVGLAKRMKQNT